MVRIRASGEYLQLQPVVWVALNRRKQLEPVIPRYILSWVRIPATVDMFWDKIEVSFEGNYGEGRIDMELEMTISGCPYSRLLEYRISSRYLM